MIVITGSLNNHSGCVSQETESFSKCVAACGNRETCQVCYGAGNRICVLCDTGIVNTNHSSQKLGVKTKIYDNVCPIGLIVLTSALNTTTVSQTQTTSTMNSPTTTALSKINRGQGVLCGPGFKKFLLPNNVYWCQKIITNMPGGKLTGMNKLHAENLCMNESAVISGLEIENELEYAINLIGRILKNNGKDISLWIDGVFREECYDTASTTKECEGLKGFEFSDPSLQNFSGYHWADNEPLIDYSLEDKIPYCLKLMVPYEEDGKTTNRNQGKVAVVACSSSDTESLPSTVLCGAPPIENS